MNLNYETLYAFSLATAALALSPGPDNIYVLTQSLANGKKYGLATLAGLLSGCLVHTTLLAFGVSVIIRESDTLFLGIKILGAVYLLYLAFIVYRSDSTLDIAGDKVAKKGLWQLFKRGFIMNVLNPKVTIFFLAFFPGFLFSETLSTVLQFYVLGLLFMTVSGFIFSGIAVLSGTISKFLVHNKNVGPVLKWLQIVVFICIALYLLLSDN
ncbi:Threonine/homoserine/homoserine lactone efflux protein [Pricia antarctica]|uniref:Threonine/homoserine/homoserine lactone efflux protein n=1 Tax=Pricia antarctica TaxID=641691 RepID=A0A1G6ZWQ6_9FLAO|nr:Threonine/homoserine/homoserine lactone efflux protein [Pricia antarctica]